MKVHLMKIVVILLCLCQTFMSVSQISPINADEARKELKKMGVEEEELNERLLEKGIDVNNLASLNATQLLNVQQTIEETIAEIIAEKELEQFEIPDQIIAQDSLPDSTLAIEFEVQQDSLIIEDDEIEEAPSLIYGQALFKQAAAQKTKSNKPVNPSSDYVLGAGDQITISIFSNSAQLAEKVFTIDKSGFIRPDRMQRIQLKGLSITQAEKKLMTAFRQNYVFSSGEFSVNVSSPRNVNVGFYGNVKQVGNITIPATTTAFNALASIGGPTETGSLRKIKIVRGDEVILMDVYKLMMAAPDFKNHYLQDNDLIIVPDIDKLVRIEGAVKRPFFFELITGENLSELIQYAGGLTDVAYTGNIQIKRKFANDYRLVDVNYDDILNRNSDFSLNPGDVVSVRELKSEVKNNVYAEGEIQFPGAYSLNAGMRVSDLIQRAQFSNLSRKDLGFLYRLNQDSTYQFKIVNLNTIQENRASEDNLQLMEGDRLLVLNAASFKNKYTFTINGEVRQEGEYEIDQGGQMRVSDALLIAGGTKPETYNIGHILRTDINNSRRQEWITFDLSKTDKSKNSINTIFVQPQDQLFLYNANRQTSSGSVLVSGAVRNPIILPFGAGMKVSDLILTADGLTDDASTTAYITRQDPKNNNIEFYITLDVQKAMENRAGSDDVELAIGDRLFIYNNAELTDRFEVWINGEVRKPGRHSYGPNMTLKKLLTLAGGLTFSAARNRVDIFRLVFEENQPVKKEVAQIEIDSNLNVIGLGEFSLKPFDVVVVRRMPGFQYHETITLEGEFRFPGKYPLLNVNERITDLIKRSGGWTEEAFLAGATMYRTENDKGFVVIKLNEIVRNKKSPMNITLRDGDIITLPKSEDLVTISGAVELNQQYDTLINSGNSINVAYLGRRTAVTYLNEYTGGIKKNSNKKHVIVKYPNGEIKKSKNFILFATTPKVEAGSEIKVVYKEKSKKRKAKEKNGDKTDWGKIVGNSITQMGAVLSLILLIQQINK